MIAIIGLDGATWDLARPFLDAGDMPALAALRARGAHGVLRSTVPPVTFPAELEPTDGALRLEHSALRTVRRAGGALASATKAAGRAVTSRRGGANSASSDITDGDDHPLK